MEQAWDLAALGAELKSKGLDLTEDAIKHALEAIFNWSEKSIVLSPNKFDDAALVLVPSLKAAALGYADSIDGKVG